jgi:hypothetical protein
MRQASPQYGRLGPPGSRAALPSSQPQVFDITMGDAPEDIDPVLREDRAKEMAERLYGHILNVLQVMSLDEVEDFEKVMEGATLRNIIQQIHEYMEQPTVLGDIRGTPLMEAVKNLVGHKFVNSLKKDLSRLVSTRKGASQSSSSSQAIAPQPQPQRQQRTRAAAAAAAYVPPPRPILQQAIADAPQAPQGPQKRSVEEIEGIEEREISPKTKAKAKSTTTKAEASDPRALSLEEQARAETILNTFMRKEVKFVSEINVDEIEDHLKKRDK